MFARRRATEAMAAMAVLAAGCRAPPTTRTDAGPAPTGSVAPPRSLPPPPVRSSTTGPVGPALTQAASDGCHPFWREVELGCSEERIRKEFGVSKNAAISVCDPVHERLTRSVLAVTLGRPAPPDDPVVSEYLRGVLWNDDPSGLLANAGPHDFAWCRAFRSAQTAASSGHAAGPDDSLVARSQFGDLQFLHALGGAAQEPAKTTYQQITTWLEFTYRVGTGEIPGTEKLSTVPVENLAAQFRHQSEADVAGLFGVHGKGDVKARALGSFLHVLQDLLGGGHARIRDTNPETLVLENFFTNATAVHPLHGGDPGWRKAWEKEAPLDALPRGRQAIERGIDVLRFASHRQPWPVVHKYLDHFLFEFASLDHPAETWTAGTIVDRKIERDPEGPPGDLHLTKRKP